MTATETSAPAGSKPATEKKVAKPKAEKAAGKAEKGSESATGSGKKATGSATKGKGQWCMCVLCFFAF